MRERLIRATHARGHGQLLHGGSAGRVFVEKDGAGGTRGAGHIARGVDLLDHDIVCPKGRQHSAIFQLLEAALAMSWLGEFLAPLRSEGGANGDFAWDREYRLSLLDMGWGFLILRAE